MSEKKHGWKLEGELVIESGAELLERLADQGDPGDEEKGVAPRHGLWVGDDILNLGWALFKEDEDGEIEDVPAKRVAKVIFDHQYDGRVYVDDRHRDMVKQLCETGEYVPKVNKSTSFVDKLERVKRGVKKKVGRPKKAETVTE